MKKFHVFAAAMLLFVTASLSYEAAAQVKYTEATDLTIFGKLMPTPPTLITELIP